jgi:DNA sulfur modification protein DndD
VKLIKANFKNFRLLRDISVNFSVDDEKKLTVIRAENGTGKTTLMSALIWGFYGSRVVTEKIYPLSVVDDNGTESQIGTEVEIDFTAEEVTTRNSRTVVKNKKYRLVRKVITKVSSFGKSFSQGQDEVILLEYDETGFKPVIQSKIESIIERTLPLHLKDIYFTDGDAALTFIESTATATEKKYRVRKAIESLLSMKELESIIKNLKKVKLSFAAKIDNTDYGKWLLDAETKYQDNEEWIEGAEDDLNNCLEKKQGADSQSKTLKSKIEEQLKLGNKAVLAAEIKGINKLIERSRDGIKTSVSDQCNILNDKDLAIDLIGSKLETSISLLKKMNAKDQFPMQFIPVLKHALNKNECLCGSDLSETNPEGKSKRLYMSGIIHDCKQVDQLNKRASNLFFASDKYTKDESSKGWINEYEKCINQFFSYNSTLDENLQNQKKKEAVLDEISDDLLNAYREQASTTEFKIREFNAEITKLTEEIRRSKERNLDVKKDIEKYSSKLGKNNTAGGKHTLTDTVLKIFDNTFEVIKTTELEKVSKEMNSIFLSMIGVESGLNPNGMIRSCRLTQEFEIKVFGPNDQPLNPDTELNGASRRAITLSFILALTKVSNVTAANIIDTPLGMTSGLVKQSILKNLIKQGSQIIMFLTYDEIKGVEEIIDQYAGSTVTLSFSGHYPIMLKNKPSRQGESMLCECNHRQCCEICERTDQTNMQLRRT